MKIEIVIIITSVVVFEVYYDIQVEFTNISTFVNLKQTIFNDIIIYEETSFVRTQIINVVVIYFNIWHDNDTIVCVFSKEWMLINIQLDAKIEIVKIYSLNSIDRKIVNEIFDKLYVQERMKYTTQSTLYKYSIFVVWRIIIDFDDSERKRRTIIDIRDLNKIAITDSYFMSLQNDITSIVVDYKYISIFDAIEFFYQ